MYRSIIALALVAAFAAFATTAQAQIGADGSIFFDTFDGAQVDPGPPAVGSPNPSGGTSDFASSGGYPVLPRFYVDDLNDGVQFTVSGALEEQEYNANLAAEVSKTTDFAVETTWVVDFINGENATVMYALNAILSEESLLRVEAKPSLIGSGWQMEIAGSGSGNLGNVGPDLAFGASHTIVLHNLGDGTADLYVNNGIVGNYPTMSGDIGRIGSLGNNSSQIQNGADMFLEEISVGTFIPEPGTLALAIVGGLMMLKRRR
ncbi:MAG: hypothetical protein CMJ18_05210 [Phycisphaeraceae bacterium]|nr:hypothetical protein [Phycisphaeraceae bacterium]